MDNKNNLIYETVGIILINGKKRYLTKDNTLMEFAGRLLQYKPHRGFHHLFDRNR
mgnify:CR=1 FL=1